MSEENLQFPVAELKQLKQQQQHISKVTKEKSYIKDIISQEDLQLLGIAAQIAAQQQQQNRIINNKSRPELQSKHKSAKVPHSSK
ncbi:xre family transcriptional regulator, partial [Lasius niger]